MNNENEQQAADLINQAYSSGQPCDPICELLPENDLEAAYRVQSINTNRWMEQGRSIAGYKIGLTSRAVQQQLGVEQPDFGVLFADMAIADGESMDFSRLLQPKVEAEIALVLGDDINPTLPTAADIIRATAFVLPAIEVVDSRIRNWEIGILDTIADNASSGLFVLGNTPRKLMDLDLYLCGMVMTCEGEPVSTGAGKACLGHPLNAAVWLARTLASKGIQLQAGTVLLTGALGPLYTVSAGSIVEAKISGVGTVTADFTQTATGE